MERVAFHFVAVGGDERYDQGVDGRTVHPTEEAHAISADTGSQVFEPGTVGAVARDIETHAAGESAGGLDERVDSLLR